MKRRQFLKRTALAVGATVGLEGCGHPEDQLIPLLVPEETLVPGREYWRAGVCRECSAGCGIRVRTMLGERTRTVHGRRARVRVRQAKKIEGNPEHPVNRGKLCARGQAALQVLYNPDRLRGPLQRTGARGSGEYAEVSWEAALQSLAGRLRELRECDEAERLFFLTGHLPGHVRVLVERFMQAFGSPNHATYEIFSDGAVREANRRTMGKERFATYDLENARYVISFGANFLETWRSPVHYSRAFGKLRQGRPGVRGKVVQVEPRCSLTAANADEWLPVAPGREGALAMGIAHVLIQEDRYDRQFVEQGCRGFPAFRERVLEQYSPERVSEMTGLPLKTIVRIAREFADHQGLALGGGSAGAHTNGVFNLTAVLALNALVANVGPARGVTFAPDPPFQPLPPLPHLDERLLKSPSDWRAWVEQLRTGQPYAVEMLLLYESNPLFLMPESFRLREALEKVPFIVSFSSFPDESTQMADLILPDHTSLESWWDDVPDPGVGRAAVGLAPPVVRPLYETRGTADVLMEAARAVGEDVGAAFPWPTFEELLKEAYQGLHQAGGRDESFEAFWSRVGEAGGWWEAKDPPAATGGEPCFDFAAILSGPQEAEFAGEAGDYPFHLYLYPSIAFSDGRGANQPWLQELPDPMTTVVWGSWVEINPKTAGRLGIREGDLVSVESPHGEIRAPALLFPGARPDAVHVPAGQGHEAYGRYAQQRGANAIAILAPLLEPASGMLAWAGTRVRITRVGGAGPLIRTGEG